MTDDPKPTIPHTVVPAPGPSGIAEVDKLSEEYGRLAVDYRAARAGLDELRGQRRGAQQTDLARATAAIRAGKPDPGRQQEAALDAELAAAVRRIDLLACACNQAQDDLRDAIGVHQDDLEARYAQRRDAARTKLQKQVDAVEQTVAELAACDVGATTTARWPSRAKTAPARLVANGVDASVADVLEGLRRLYAPMPPDTPEWITPKRVAQILGHNTLADAEADVAELVKDGHLKERIEHLKDERGEPAPQYWYLSEQVIKVKAERARQAFERSRQKRNDRRKAALLEGSPAA